MTADRTPRTDLDLIDAVNEGDVDAFETLYARYRDWVVALAWRLTGSRADALDVLQETFTYLLGKFPGFQLTAAMKTFLYPVVRNLSIRAVRKRRRHAPGEEALPDLAAPETPDSASREELAAVVAVLDDAHREVLLMRFVDDMTTEEVAIALEVPVGTEFSGLRG